MFSSTFSLVALAAALIAPTAVNAHGYVHSLDVGGKNYTGWLPFTDPCVLCAPGLRRCVNLTVLMTQVRIACS